MADTKMRNIHVEESAGLKIDKFICKTHVFWALFPLGIDAKMTARQTKSFVCLAINQYVKSKSFS